MRTTILAGLLLALLTIVLVAALDRISTGSSEFHVV